MNLALAGLVVLLIGDSHIASKDFFNNAVHEALQQAGARVHSYGVCGSGAGDWVKSKLLPCGRGERHGEAAAQIDRGDKVAVWPLAELIARHHPDLVVVELGDNMAGYSQFPSLPHALIEQQVKALTGVIAAKRVACVWIGPPWGAEGGMWGKTFARVRELSEELARDVAPCRYVDSLRFAKPGEWPTFDGVHLTLDGYALWSRAIVASISAMAPELRKH
jgi:lysophospholipase L1-like esterase